MYSSFKELLYKRETVILNHTIHSDSSVFSNMFVCDLNGGKAIRYPFVSVVK